MRYYNITIKQGDSSEADKLATSALKMFVPGRVSTLQEARSIRAAAELLFHNSAVVEIRSTDDRLV